MVRDGRPSSPNHHCFPHDLVDGIGEQGVFRLEPEVNGSAATSERYSPAISTCALRTGYRTWARRTGPPGPEVSAPVERYRA